MSIRNIKLENFTVFEKIDIDFAGGINVIIGKNGTGKTHLMKVICASKGKDMKMSDYFKGDTLRKTPKLDNIFKNMGLLENNDQLTLENAEQIKTLLEKKIKEKTINEVLTFEEKIEIQKIDIDGELVKFFFIPTNNIMAHSKGFLSLYNKYKLPFDRTYYDIINSTLLPELREIPQIGKNIIPMIEKIIEGKVIVKDETFIIEKFDGNEIEFSMESEGLKKFGALWQLIMTGNITENSVLFWDEPEANINPSLVPDVIEILLELSRNGVQIFIATHDYNFAKYIEVLMNESDDVAFHALYKTESEGVKCETETKFTLLFNNALREDNINLYDAEMKKEFGE